MLQLHNIKKFFEQNGNKHPVLSGISCIFEKGLSYAISGISGSGKSTLMHCIVGIDTVTSGSIILNNKPISLLTNQERARAIAFVTQHSFLIKELSVEENLWLAGRIAGIPEDEIHASTNTLLSMVNLNDACTMPIGALSGGQRHRVALARALLVEPQFLCADEITGSLDEKLGQEIIKMIKTMCFEKKIGLIISSHNPTIIEQMDVIFVLKNGTLSPQIISNKKMP